MGGAGGRAGWQAGGLLGAAQQHLSLLPWWKGRQGSLAQKLSRECTPTCMIEAGSCSCRCCQHGSAPGAALVFPPGHCCTATGCGAAVPAVAGLVLRAGEHPDLAPQRVLERPKVLHNPRTRRFVMWMHIDE